MLACFWAGGTVRILWACIFHDLALMLAVPTSGLGDYINVTRAALGQPWELGPCLSQRVFTGPPLYWGGSVAGHRAVCSGWLCGCKPIRAPVKLAALPGPMQVALAAGRLPFWLRNTFGYLPSRPVLGGLTADGQACVSANWAKLLGTDLPATFL